MKTSKMGRGFISKWEGLKARKYICPAGKPTIGVGHLLTAEELRTGFIKIGNEKIDWRKGLTWDQVDDLLSQDLVRFESAVNSANMIMSQHEFDALVSLSFNIGVSAFKRSTLYKILLEKRREEIPAQIKRWNRAGGQVMKGLIRRRNAEIELFNNGIYQG
jgi:lysozyme